jgi:ABC-type Co2+ transport system permease subunit
VAVVEGVKTEKSAVVWSVVAHLVDGGGVVSLRRDQKRNVVVVVAAAAAAHVVVGSDVVVAIETAVPKVWKLPTWRPRYCKMLSYPVV